MKCSWPSASVRCTDLQPLQRSCLPPQSLVLQSFGPDVQLQPLSLLTPEHFWLTPEQMLNKRQLRPEDLQEFLFHQERPESGQM